MSSALLGETMVWDLNATEMTGTDRKLPDSNK